MLARVASALRAFHDGSAIPGSFDSFRVVETYRETALARGGTIPDAYDWAHGIASRIEALRGDVERRPCHNDLLNANFLDDGERLRIVDWEYAGMGDVFFDLANFSINHELDADGCDDLAARLLRGCRDPKTRLPSSSCASCPTSARRCGASCRRAVSALDFDFPEYASEHFERLERTASSRSFRAALGCLNARGAPRGAPRERKPWLGPPEGLRLGGKLELGEPLFLQSLELFVCPHSNGALEPVLGR